MTEAWNPLIFRLKAQTRLFSSTEMKYEEITDEIIIIHRDTATLELGQYIYEFIALAIPLKKLHPSFRMRRTEDDSEGKIVYTSEAAEEKKDEEDIDPRWNILKKLK